MIAIILVSLGIYASLQLEYNWQWYRVEQFLFTIQDGIFKKGLLFDGLLVTIQISAISLFFSIIINHAERTGIRIR